MKCYAIENHPNDSRVTIDPAGIVQTLSSRMGTGGNNTPFVLITSTSPGSQSGNHTRSQASGPKAEAADAEVKDSFVCNSSGDGIAAPLDASYFKGQGLRQGIEREYVMMKAYATGNGQLANSVISENTVGTLDCMHDQKMVIIDKEPHYYTKQRHDEFVNGTVASSLKSRDYKEFTDLVQEETMEKKYVLRRLTPVECLRLQGLPDWWCDNISDDNPSEERVAFIANAMQEMRKIDKKLKPLRDPIKSAKAFMRDPYSDSAVYKMAGNGLAIPCACDLLGRIAEELQRNE